MDLKELERRVREQVALIQDPGVAAAINALLVEPYCVEREWDYGTPGQRFPCWTVP